MQARPRTRIDRLQQSVVPQWRRRINTAMRLIATILIVLTYGQIAIAQGVATGMPNIEINIRGPGQLWDKESGMVYSAARTYCPACGARFTQPDPAGLTGGINRYEYVRNNPLSYFDQDGLSPESPKPVPPRPELLAPIGGGGMPRRLSPNSPIQRVDAPVPFCPPTANPSAGLKAADGAQINGFTRHGIDRVIGDQYKRAGTRPDAILDALRDPVSIKDGVDQQGRPFRDYRSNDARVVINPETGQIVTTMPLSRRGRN